MKWQDFIWRVVNLAGAGALAFVVSVHARLAVAEERIAKSEVRAAAAEQRMTAHHEADAEHAEAVTDTVQGQAIALTRLDANLIAVQERIREVIEALRSRRR